MIRSNLFDYCHAYIHFNKTITVPNTGIAAAPNNRNKSVTCKTCASFTTYLCEINNTQVDDAHDIDEVMLMYNSIKHSDAYSKTSGILWQY